MATVKFKPNDTAPSDAGKTQYNVFVDGQFAGYISKSWMDYWTYYVDGVNALDNSYSDRHDLFNEIKQLVA